MSWPDFHPVVREWFAAKFGVATAAQERGWPAISAGRHTLIAAPTGSGKTLAAFLVCLDQLWRQASRGQLPDSTQVVYVSPLKALSSDIDRNLQRPLAELGEVATRQGLTPPAIRTAVRTGDTPPAQRQAMLRHPPHILVTTPESLFLLLTSGKSREMLRTVRTVIVDEIHALARDKRGSHLSLTLERLEALCDQPPVRIGLSATQRPLDEMARFLVGHADRTAEIVDVGHSRQLDLTIETPPTPLSAVCSHEQWDEVYARLGQLISEHRSTLIFVNTRRMAERLGHRLRESLGQDAVASHHGSLAKELRHSAEQRLKNGELRALVATSSLEMGIDIGYIDLVCQIGSPRSISAFLQRIGRSGHSLGATPKGRLFPLTRDELLECMALIRAVRRGELDRIEIPRAPLDILAQQIVAAVACEDWSEADLYERCRAAYPYRDLSRGDFERVICLLSEGLGRAQPRGQYLHRDRIHGQLRARRGARLAAITSGGAIPDAAEYRVVTDGEGVYLGKLDEDFAIESMAGDVFLLGNHSWRVKHIRAGEVVVTDAQGAPPSVPFWLGEGPGRTWELSQHLSELRSELAAWEREAVVADERLSRLADECGAPAAAAQQALDYTAAAAAALGVMPVANRLVFERFFDESGGMQLVIHSPLGQRINRAWGLALRKRFCRSFDFELQAAATDNGILLSLSPQHSFPIESLFKMLGPHNAEHLLTQAILAQPLFQVRWRWNVTRALLVLRQQRGKRVPPHMIRFRSDDLLAAAFPETVGCLENHHGDVQIPDHPLVSQTLRDCLLEALDLPRWLSVLGEVREGRVELVARDTREPSPFCQEILNAQPYAFLDGAPLEERRTRAVATRRTWSTDEMRNLAALDPQAVAAIRDEAAPLVRDREELHDLLLTHGVLLASECEPWNDWCRELQGQGRACQLRWNSTADGSVRVGWGAAEKWPLVRAVWPLAVAEPLPRLPEDLDVEWEASAALVELLRGRISVRAPVTASQLAAELGLQPSTVHAALEAIEASGAVLRGHFTAAGCPPAETHETEWCDRRLLARIHRLTLDNLRRRIQPVSPRDFQRFLLRRHQRTGPLRRTGPEGVRDALRILQGFEAPAGAWERQLLESRVVDYHSSWLDQLFQSGEVVWGRLHASGHSDSSPSSTAALTRAMPISLLLRLDAGWLTHGAQPLPEAERVERGDGGAGMRGDARRVLEALTTRGALFFQELQVLLQLLPAHLESALRELAAAGLVTCDGFSPIRSFVSQQRGSSRRRSSNGMSGTVAPVGRWSLFPGLVAPPVPAEERLERWCQLLLARYGVVFRDLLAREASAPSWTELVPILRRMEMRGSIRGGRFVSGVGGEQYALEDAIERLREARDETDCQEWALVSAADPLNLAGIIDQHGKVPAIQQNLVLYRDGAWIGSRIGREVVLTTGLSAVEQADARRQLQTGRLTPQPHVLTAAR